MEKNIYFTVEDSDGIIRPLAVLWRDDKNLKYCQPEIEKYMEKVEKEGSKECREKIEKKETKEKIKVKNKEEINKIPDQKIPQKQKQEKKEIKKDEKIVEETKAKNE